MSYYQYRAPYHRSPDAAELDPRAFAEEVDIVPSLPSGLSTALASSKWKERKEVLDDLATVLTSTPRIKDAPELGDVVKGLAGRMGDANINCVIAAAVCMEALAKGMMGAFARFREAVVPPMLERLKERKANVTDAIGLALDAIFITVSLKPIDSACGDLNFVADNSARDFTRYASCSFIQESSSERRDHKVPHSMSYHNSYPTCSTSDKAII